jgi:hypothetical protein
MCTACPASAAAVIEPELPATLSLGGVLRIAIHAAAVVCADDLGVWRFSALFAVMSVLTFRLLSVPAGVVRQLS